MELHLKKNEAAEIMFPMLDSAAPASFKTGLTVADTGYYKDGAGAWTALSITDTVTEIGTTGMYTIELTAGELNHDEIMIKFTSTGAADTAVIIRTYAVDVDDLVRSSTPANALAVDANNRIDVGKWLGTAVTISGTSAKPEIDVYSVSDDATAANNLESFTDGTGYAGTNNVIPTVTTITNSVGLTSAAVQAIWDALTSALTTTGSVGKLIVDNLNAAISSRSSHAAADIWSVVTRTLTDKANFSLAADQSGVTFGTVNALGTQAKADVNAEVVDAVGTDTIPELSQAQPPATPTIKQALMLLYMALRNEETQTATTMSIKSDDGTVITKATVSDDGTTFTRQKLVSGA